MTGYYPEGRLMNTVENLSAMQSLSQLNEAYHDGRILEARAVVCDSSHNLLVDLGAIKGIIPREEGAIGIREGTVRDIAVISRVNRPVCFVITDFRRNESGKTVAILSRRLAQERCMKEYISGLVPGDVIFIREEGTNAPQLKDALVAVHDRELVAAHELMAGFLIVEAH